MQSHQDLRDEPLEDSKDPQGVCIRPAVALAAEGLAAPGQQVGDRARVKSSGSFVSAPVAPETHLFRRRLLELVQAAPEYAELKKSERRYLDVLITQVSDRGGEMRIKHDEIALLVGQTRRNVIRVMKALVDSGVLTVSAQWRHSSRGLVDRAGNLQNSLRCANVYRIANRFMSALKAARKLIRRRNVTASKPLSLKGGVQGSRYFARFKDSIFKAVKRAILQAFGRAREADLDPTGILRLRAWFDEHELPPGFAFPELVRR